MTVPASDYAYLADLVRRESAICLPPGKEYLVQARLAPIARDLGLSGVPALVSDLRLGSPGLADMVVAAMATKETSWLRDFHPFEALRTHVIPELLTRTRAPRFWSAAAATGQEAYSLAMILLDHFPTVAPPAVLATDLTHDALERARAGRYSQLEVNRGLPARLLVRHFERDELEWQVAADVRAMVTFRQLNLARPWPARGAGLWPGPASFDVVALRNVLIYFDIADRRAILERVARVLRPGGYLLLGGAETLVGVDSPFRRFPIGKSQFYRLGGPSSAGSGSGRLA